MRYVSVLVSMALMSACSSQPAPPAAQSAAPATIPITTKSDEARAHFDKGHMLFENLRQAEAVAELDQAVKLDPDFLSARMLRGVVTPGPDGVKELDAAVALAGSLPEAERLYIAGAAAVRHGEFEKAEASVTRLTELAPGDARAFYALGQVQLFAQKYADAAAALRKATELNPSSGGAQNMLGYAALRQGDTAGAIAAFEQYTRILPQEPNSHDSLGEALLAAGRFTDAEAAFQKSLDLSPQFWAAHEGIAYARSYAGDWAGGRAAFTKGKDTATRWPDKMQMEDGLVAAAAAQREFAQALRILDALEKTPGPQPSDLALVPLRRGLVYIDWGRPRQALAPLNTAIATADSGTLPPDLIRTLKREGLRLRAMAETGLGDAAAAEKTSAALDAEAAAHRDDVLLQSAMHQGRAMMLVAKGDVKAAQAEFSQCSQEDLICLWQAVVAADKAGDKTTAASTRDAVLKVYRRDPAGLVLRSRLASAPATRS